jgi:hypothetical protein
VAITLLSWRRYGSTDCLMGSHATKVVGTIPIIPLFLPMARLTIAKATRPRKVEGEREQR